MRMLSDRLDSVLAGQPLSPAAGVELLQQTDPQVIAEIQAAADQLRQQQVGDTVTYVVNRNLNFTNICEQHCSFCAFRRDEGQADAYWLTEAQMLAKVADAVQQGATEICIQGGLHPGAKKNGQSLAYYVTLIQAIGSRFRDLHLHAFSPQEVQFIAREDDRSYA